MAECVDGPLTSARLPGSFQDEPYARREGLAQSPGCRPTLSLGYRLKAILTLVRLDSV